MKIMAVDLGKARTGIAICDVFETLASPFGVIEERSIDKLVLKVADIAKEHNIEEIVLGLPKNMDGSEGESAQNARAFGAKLEDATGLKVNMMDERGTTISAHNYLNITDTRGKKRKSIIDSVSAVIILENYLSFRKHKDFKI